MRLALVVGKLKQIQRAVDVHHLRRNGRELHPHRPQRRPVEYTIDIELSKNALEQPDVGDQTGELAANQAAQGRLKRRDIDGDDRTPCSGEASDQAVADFAVGTRDQDGRGAHPILSGQPAQTSAGLMTLKSPAAAPAAATWPIR